MSDTAVVVGAVVGSTTRDHPWVAAARRRPGVALAALLAMVLVGGALVLPWVAPLDQIAVNLDRIDMAPSWSHLAGTDGLGRDVLLRSLYSLRVSLLVGLAAAMAASLIGGVVGLVAATCGGRVDQFLMRVVDTVASVPHLLLGLFIVAMLRPSLMAVIIAVALTHWLSTARIVRSEVLSLRDRPFVDAAIGGGASRRYVLKRHFLPHVLPQILVATTLMVPHAIWHETALSFLGLGLPPHLASLGNMISDGRRSLLAGVWWPSIVPGLFIVVVTLAIATLAGAWRDHLSPRRGSEYDL